MPDDTTSIQGLILSQLKDIAAEVKNIPGLQTKVSILSDDTREMAQELRMRDHAQQQSIEIVKVSVSELQLEQSKMLASLAGINSLVTELKYELTQYGQRLTSAEQQVKALFDTQLELGRHVREIREATANIVDGNTMQRAIDELECNRPWIHGFIWFARIILGLLGAAAAGGLIWLLGQTITGAI